jgi:hypothetical protein
MKIMKLLFCTLLLLIWNAPLFGGALFVGSAGPSISPAPVVFVGFSNDSSLNASVETGFGLEIVSIDDANFFLTSFTLDLTDTEFYFDTAPGGTFTTDFGGEPTIAIPSTPGPSVSDDGQIANVGLAVGLGVGDSYNLGMDLDQYSEIAPMIFASTRNGSFENARLTLTYTDGGTGEYSDSFRLTESGLSSGDVGSETYTFRATAVPEPGSLVLGMILISTFGLIALWKKRKKA